MKATLRRKRGVLFYALLLLVVGIWGLFFYRLLLGLLPNGAEEAVLMAAPSGPGASEALATEVAAEAPPSFRDPFRAPSGLFPPDTTALVVQLVDSVGLSEPPEPEAPSLLLQGVVGPTALLVDSAGVIHFVQAGQELDGVRIVRVYQDSVMTRFNGDRQALTFSP
ncbi:MAG: hypothetical protein AAF970_06950 [Bacteroidota bacterium]